MSGKLDRSLDQIMSESKAAGGKGANGRRRNAVRKTNKSTVAPAGGIQKNTKPAKAATVGKHAKGAKVPITGESKIIVSNLPVDVSESIIKDFFNQSVGNVKKVLLSYNAAGQSRGQATVIFSKPENAAKAQQGFNGVAVDKVPIKIETVEVVSKPAPKTLQDRMSQPKAVAKKEKGAVAAKTAATNGAAKGKGKKGKKSGNAGRPKRKTAEELDAEMQDYWGAGEGATGAGANAAPAAAPAAADTGMVDEVM